MKTVLTWSTMLIALLALVFPVSAPQASWPMFQLNPQHSGVTAQDGAESDSAAWAVTIPRPTGWSGDIIWASPIINTAASAVYIATRFGRVYSFSLAQGDTIWARSLPGVITSTPALSGNDLFVLCRGDHRLHCLNVRTGDSVWASSPLGSYWASPDSWLDSSPTVVQDSIFVGSGDGFVYCISAADGSQIWKSADQLGEYIASSPAYAAGHVYVGSTRGENGSEVWCIDSSTGASVWYYTPEYGGNDGGTMSSPTIADGNMYIGMNDACDPPGIDWGGSVTCLALLEESESHPYEAYPVWRFGIQCDVRGTPVVLGDSCYVTSGRDLFVFEKDHGDPRRGLTSAAGIPLEGSGMETWSSFAVSQRASILDHEIMFFVGDGGSASEDANVYGLDQFLNVRWRYDVDCRTWATPAISGGKVVFGASNGRVLCFVDDSENGRIACPKGMLTYWDGLESGPRAERGTALRARAVQRLRAVAHPIGGEQSVKLSLPSNVQESGIVWLFDVTGRVLRRWDIGRLPDRGADWEWRLQGIDELSPGVYMYRMSADGLSWSGRVLLRP